MKREVNPQEDLCVQLTITLADDPELVDEIINKINRLLEQVNHDIDQECIGMPFKWVEE